MKLNVLISKIIIILSILCSTIAATCAIIMHNNIFYSITSAVAFVISILLCLIGIHEYKTYKTELMFSKAQKEQELLTKTFDMIQSYQNKTYVGLYFDKNHKKRPVSLMQDFIKNHKEDNNPSSNMIIDNCEIAIKNIKYLKYI
jgi:cytochrome c biogenesis protein CcdA